MRRTAGRPGGRHQHGRLSAHGPNASLRVVHLGPGCCIETQAHGRSLAGHAVQRSTAQRSAACEQPLPCRAHLGVRPASPRPVNAAAARTAAAFPPCGSCLPR